MRNILLTMLFSTILMVSACGGGSGGGTQTGNNPNLPPDPGDAGRTTLLGIDSDSDGVRDDVQRAIATRYPSNKNSQLALSQLAKGIQEAFIAQSANDANQLNDTFQKIVKATDCITVTTAQPLQDIVFIQTLMSNTNVRSDAYVEVNAAASGQFFGGDGDLESACQR